MTKTLKSTLIGFSVLYILLGLALLIWPVGAQTVICYVLGAAAIVYGIVRIILYFSGKDPMDAVSLGLVTGILFVLLGLFLLIWHNTVVSIFGFLIGVAIVLNSVFLLQMAFELKRYGSARWFLILILAVVMLAAGIVLVCNPAGSALAWTIVAGAFLLTDGVMSLISYIIWLVRFKKAQDASAPSFGASSPRVK